MQGKKKKRALVLSVSLLILLIIIYSASGSGRRTDSDGPTLASRVVVACHNVASFTNDVFEKISYKIELKMAEREAEKISEAMQNEEVASGDEPVDVPENEVSLLEEPDIEEEEAYVEVTEYVPFYEIQIPEDLKVPSTVDDVEFRPVDDYVYSADEAKYYGTPGCDKGAMGTAKKWEEFRRVGISEGCCYQLITKEGFLVYADGTHFRRNREDSPTTESIKLKKEKVQLEVEYVSQFPTLTNGSEVTCLATVLNYLGYDISKDQLSDEFLPKGKAGYTNFYDAFVGDPANRNSYGCYAGAIVTAGNAYLDTVESDLRTRNLTGTTVENLLNKIKTGTPAIVWTTADLNAESEFTKDWIVDGEYLVWKSNMHCVVLIGYDLINNIVIVCDPTKGLQEIDLTDFIKSFKEFYSQAVVIE